MLWGMTGLSCHRKLCIGLYESASTYFVDADCYCGIHISVHVLLLVVTEEVCPLEDTVDIRAALRVVPMLVGVCGVVKQDKLGS